MEKIKQLNTLIDQACSEAHNQPPVKIYTQILNIIQSRVDLPKHAIAAISKKLTHKSKKILFIAFDMLEYLSYNLELPFFSQIATKEFLFKISGLLMNKETEPFMVDKILKFIKCLDELFRPLEDFLPLFFQFEAGLLRKQYQIQYDYVSPYRPKQLKQYKKPQKTEQKKKKLIVEPTKDEQKRFQEIREKIILVNEIITNSDPSEDIRKNDLLIELVQQLKQSQKIINSTIDENPTQKIMQLALATNDDLVTTYRRFKDLQRNRKPQLFIMAELASDNIKEESRPMKKQPVQQKKPEVRPQSKPESQKFQSIFEAFEIQNSTVSPKKQQPAKNQPTKSNQNIFDLIDGNDEKQSEVTQASQIVDPFGLMDIGSSQNTSVVSQQNNSMNLDLLGGSSSQNHSEANLLVNQMFSLNLGQPSVTNALEVPSQKIFQRPSYQTMQLPLYQPNQQIPTYQSGVYQLPINQSNLAKEFLMSPVVSQPVVHQPIYQNISLNLSEEPKQEQPQQVDPIKKLTNLSEEFKF